MEHYKISKRQLFIAGFVAMLGMASCKSTTSPSTTTPSTAYTETVLVADTLGFNAAHIDTTYVNGWGISVGGTGKFWISSNHGGVTDVYDGTGATVIPAVTIPSSNGTDPGSPSGVIFNSTSDFGGGHFIYSTEDGIIASWLSGGSAVKVATGATAGTVYKGIAMGSSGGNNYLYATDFHNGKIDVYDKTFAPKSGMAFSDHSIPAGYAPFGIQNVGGVLYVTYAQQKGPDNMDDQAGAGFGYVDVFNTDGTFVKRFASQGTLNSPWGIAVAPSTFGQFKNAVLISNFGDGTISGFDSTGTFLGQVSTDVNNTAMHISGIWGIMFTSTTGNDPNALYFTAGPDDENHGLFGYIKMQ